VVDENHETNSKPKQSSLQTASFFATQRESADDGSAGVASLEEVNEQVGANDAHMRLTFMQHELAGILNLKVV